MIGIDLFAGAGGLSLGAKLAGLNVKFANESDPFAAETYLRNHPETTVFAKDIRSLSKKDLKGLSSEDVILFGGPPCQGFSTSNQKTRNKNNPNNWLFQEFIRLAKSIKPTWIVFENVTGILGTEGGAFVDSVMDEISKMKYEVSNFVLNASDYGVPQNRSRLFVIASADGIKLNKPSAVVSQKPVSVFEAIEDLPNLENGASISKMPYKGLANSEYAKSMRRGRKLTCENNLVTRNADLVVKRYAFIPQGGNWEDIPKRLMKNYLDPSRCHTGIYHRLRADRPSVVIGNFRKNMLVHPTENRGLSVREAARIQSFPDSYIFKGSIGFQQQQVGNAVPPLLAKSVFGQILKA